MHTTFTMFHRHAVIALAIAGTVLVATPAAAQTAQVKYERALAREQAAMKADAPNLAALRTIATSYENIARQHPRSGYSDNALSQAASLLQLAWERGANARDRDRAITLLQWLRKEYPSSSLARQVGGRLAALNRAGPGVATVRRPTPPAPSAPSRTTEPLPAATVAASVPAVAPPARTTAAAPTRPAITVRGLSHMTLPRGDRLTIELSDEALYSAERREVPDELTLIVSGASAASAIVNAATTIRGGLIQSMQIDNATNGLRMTVRLSGRPRHSAFPLYNPNRLVFDFESDLQTTADAQSTAPAPAASITLASAGQPSQDPRPAPQPLPLASRPTPAPEPAVVREPSAPFPAAPAAAPVFTAITPSASTPPIVSAPQPSAAPEMSDGLDIEAVEPEPDDEPSVGTVKPVPPASTTGTGGYSLARQLGLGVSRIVIDPGHGGSDPGAQDNGVTEAALVLDVALRLEKLLKAEPGFDVVLTRRANRALSLARRTAMANEQAADLFLSIHANSSPRLETAGVETYFLNFSSNQHAAAVAARENASSSEAMHLLPELVRSIATTNKRAESRELAGMIQSSLVRRLRTRNRLFQDLGVKQAPFMVLIGAQMPSVLAEIAFVSNRAEASLLKQQAYKQQIAQALFDAIVKYRSSLKKVATVTASAEGR